MIVLAYICTDYSDHTMKKPCREIPKDLEEGSSVELIDSFISPSQNLVHYRERDDLTVMDSTLRVRTFLIVGLIPATFESSPFLCYVMSNGR